MKKTILLLLLIIPVVITVLVYLIAGFVAREIRIASITGMEVDPAAVEEYNDSQIDDKYGLYWRDEQDQILDMKMYVGQQIDFEKFIIITSEPATARFKDLVIEKSFEDVDLELPIEDKIEITEGVLTAKETCDDTIIVIIKAEAGSGGISVTFIITKIVSLEV